MAVCLNQIDDFVDRRKGKPGQPPNEQLEISQAALERRVEKLEDSLVGKEWFAKVDADLQDMKEETARHRSDRDKLDSIHRASVYRKIDEVRVGIVAQMESNRQELSVNINSMPAQVITLLKTTGAI